MHKFGFLEQAAALLRQAGMETALSTAWSRTRRSPPFVAVQKPMQAFQPDWIVAIGGGSALDAAKVMWCFYEHPHLKFEDILTPGSMPPLRNKARFVAIPSTSGTASEITAFSVITDTDNHIKYPIVAADMVPDIAILDPALPATMPPHITANTGMDVLAHAIEAVASTAAACTCRSLCHRAIRLVLENLPQAYHQGHDATARFNMHNASALAGMAFTNASLGLVHSLAHRSVANSASHMVWPMPSCCPTSFASTVSSATNMPGSTRRH